MSEHLFHAHDLGAVFEQVRGEAVAQYVRGRLAFPSDFAQQVVDVVPERPEPERLAVATQEHEARGGREVPCLYLHLFVIADAFDKTFGNGDDAFLAALAENAHELGAYVDTVPCEHLAFRNAEPGTVDEFEQDARTQLRERRVLEFGEFFFGEVLLAEYVHQALGALGHRDALGGILVENLASHHVLPEAF